MSEVTNYFAELAKINVNDHIEKKGKFSYLSWAYAVDVLRKTDPAATWEVIRFNGMPFMETKFGIFVEVAVTVQGITLSQIHPVLDNNNKPIAQPNAFQINTSIQRALVKAIALHGLGLYIYAGEDLPEGADDAKAEEAAKEEDKYLQDCKIKWQTLAGSLEGFEEWHSKKLGEGVTNKQINSLLAQKLLAKNRESA